METKIIKTAEDMDDWLKDCRSYDCEFRPIITTPCLVVFSKMLDGHEDPFIEYMDFSGEELTGYAFLLKE